jgi:hypothetical protein
MRPVTQLLTMGLTCGFSQTPVASKRVSSAAFDALREWPHAQRGPETQERGR